MSLLQPGLEGAPPREVLKRVFGYPEFRGLQAEVIDHVIAGGDALVLMPTGGGKSVCYQIPALCRPGTAIVVSPLIALMDDQVAALRQLGISAGALHSELDPAEARATSRALDEGSLDLLYVSPERLLNFGLLDRLEHLQIALLAIDEAHCVSQWGHEFRPEYRLLATLGDRFPGVPRLALTATADPRTRTDILASLGLDHARVFTASFHRPNLNISAEPKTTETGQIADLLARHPGEAGIIYCGSRARTERIATWLNAHGHLALPFHAGLPSEQKRESLTRFRAGEPLVVVATIAFGMGIDRPDVRFVAHLDMPDSPEAFYQQIGRAGRDGLPAETRLLYAAEDIGRARHFLSVSAAPEAQKTVMRGRLEAMVALTETPRCRTRALLACFGEEMAADCGHCDNCLTPAELIDGTVEAQKLLSAIYRTGQRFGGVHVINVLLGDPTEAITRWRHDQLPVFGIGADHDRDFWRGVLRQLVVEGAISQRIEGNFSTLELVNEIARPILRGEAKILMRPPAKKLRAQRAGRAERTARAAGLEPTGSPEENARFDALRAWRSAEAKSQGVPPYVIFHDAVLREIAADPPRTLAALGQVKGVGASKLDRYGPAVLQTLGITPQTATPSEIIDARIDGLMDWRTRTARAEGMPETALFHEATLRDIAARGPTTIDELGAIRGVPAAKLERYGAALLAVMRD